jgi:hypothetical protein
LPLCEDKRLCNQGRTVKNGRNLVFQSHSIGKMKLCVKRKANTIYSAFLEISPVRLKGKMQTKGS